MFLSAGGRELGTKWTGSASSGKNVRAPDQSENCWHLPVALVILKDLEQTSELFAGFAASIEAGEEFKVQI